MNLMENLIQESSLNLLCTLQQCTVTTIDPYTEHTSTLLCLGCQCNQRSSQLQRLKYNNNTGVTRVKRFSSTLMTNAFSLSLNLFLFHLCQVFFPPVQFSRIVLAHQLTNLYHCPLFLLAFLASSFPLLLKLSNICRVSTWMGDCQGKPQLLCFNKIGSVLAGAFLELVIKVGQQPLHWFRPNSGDVTSLIIYVIFTG